MEEYFSRIVNKKDKEVILEQGKDPYYAYVLLKGNANVYKEIDDEQIYVGTVEEGEVFGMLSFIRGDKRSATVIADGDVQVGMILKDTFMDHLNSVPETVYDKIVNLRDSLFSVNDAKGRMLNCLHEIEKIKGESYTRQYFKNEANVDSKLLLSVTDLMLERFDSVSDEIHDMLAKIENITKEVVQMQ
ncbi:MAG: cyclic nucleotide-binding domain-containing protein [Candidatus Scalindua sp.]|nr:cyclic nucleotide-binding domain-containing protein [Candidatus Scalindua sp.]MBT7349907.1 cyclic nucleotide-binding domain-containing protein [candidate division WWE3 bacterium]